MFFSYRKSPLGIVVKEHMISIVGVYENREDAEKDLEGLRKKISAELKIIDIDDAEGLEKVSRLDPDTVDLARRCRGRYIIIAFWGSLEP